MVDPKLTVRTILGRVIESVRAEHRSCEYGGCPWRVMHTEDQHELAAALVAAGYTLTPLADVPATAVTPLEVTQDGSGQLWDSRQVAAYVGLPPGSIRKWLYRHGIREVRGYPVASVVDACPPEKEVSA